MCIKNTNLRSQLLLNYLYHILKAMSTKPDHAFGGKILAKEPKGYLLLPVYF